MENNRVVMSLEERLKRSARSQAASPEAAAKKLLKIADIPSAIILYRWDIEMLGDLEDESSKCGMRIDDRALHYNGLCDFLSRYLWIRELYSKRMESDFAPYRPKWGTALNNMLIRLALLFIDHGNEEKRYNKDFHVSLKLTLQDYLDALVDLCFTEGGKIDVKRLASASECRALILKEHDGSKPLVEFLTELVKEYLLAKKDYDYPNYILSMLGQMEYYYYEKEIENAFLEDEADPAPEDDMEDVPEDDMEAEAQEPDPQEASDPYDFCLDDSGAGSADDAADPHDSGAGSADDAADPHDGGAGSADDAADPHDNVAGSADDAADPHDGGAGSADDAADPYDFEQHEDAGETEQGQPVPEEEEMWPREYFEQLQEDYLKDMYTGSYYFDKACAYDEPIPDPAASRNMRYKTYREWFYLHEDEIRRPQDLRKLASEIEATDWRVLLEASIDDEQMAQNMTAMNRIVAKIYMLLVEPFAAIESYHYERHFEVQ